MLRIEKDCGQSLTTSNESLESVRSLQCMSLMTASVTRSGAGLSLISNSERIVSHRHLADPRPSDAGRTAPLLENDIVGSTWISLSPSLYSLLLQSGVGERGHPSQSKIA
jgi:hypothetical protein